MFRHLFFDEPRFHDDQILGCGSQKEKAVDAAQSRENDDDDDEQDDQSGDDPQHPTFPRHRRFHVVVVVIIVDGHLGGSIGFSISIILEG